MWDTWPRALGKLQCSVVSRCRYRLVGVYYLTTLTYFEIEHVQWKQHMALVGVVDRRGW